MSRYPKRVHQWSVREKARGVATVTLVLSFLVCIRTGIAQSRIDAKKEPTFEVASVKVSGQDRSNAPWKWGDTGSVSLPRVTLSVVLMRMFGVKAYQLKGPAWLGQDHFDIDAKIPDGAAREDIPRMLEALLRDRFGLVFHREMQTLSVYGLVIAKGGPKLKASGPDVPVDWPRGLPPGQTLVKNGPQGVFGVTGQLTTAALAGTLSLSLGLPVLDLTALKGPYDIDITWMADAPPSTNVGSGSDMASFQEASLPLPSMFSVLNEKLGLSLEPRKSPVEIVVIDHIDRVPTAN